MVVFEPFSNKWKAKPDAIDHNTLLKSDMFFVLDYFSCFFMYCFLFLVAIVSNYT